MVRRVRAGDGRVAAIVSRLDEERTASSAAAAGDDVEVEEAKRQHKVMVRAAGRAAVEETLLLPETGVKRKAEMMTRASLTADWLAYAEVGPCTILPHASDMKICPTQ